MLALVATPSCGQPLVIICRSVSSIRLIRRWNNMFFVFSCWSNLFSTTERQNRDHKTWDSHDLTKLLITWPVLEKITRSNGANHPTKSLKAPAIISLLWLQLETQWLHRCVCCVSHGLLGLPAQCVRAAFTKAEALSDFVDLLAAGSSEKGEKFHTTNHQINNNGFYIVIIITTNNDISNNK